MDDVLSQAGDLSGKGYCQLLAADERRQHRPVIGHMSSGSEALAKKIPEARVVCAFNTIPSEVLFGVFEARRKPKRPSLVYCGDDARSKNVAVELIRDAAFEPVDAGPLRIAGYTEPFALLIGQLAYEGKDGPELAYRFERFENE